MPNTSAAAVGSAMYMLRPYDDQQKKRRFSERSIPHGASAPSAESSKPRSATPDMRSRMSAPGSGYSSASKSSRSRSSAERSVADCASIHSVNSAAAAYGARVPASSKASPKMMTR